MTETALERRLKNHARSCGYYRFSGDRACTCGRDEALRQVRFMLVLVMLLVIRSNRNYIE